MGIGGRAQARFVELGCGLLIAYGCGLSKSTNNEHGTGGAAGGGVTGGKQGDGGSTSSGGSGATGGSTGGSPSSGNGGVTAASGGTLAGSGNGPSSGGHAAASGSVGVGGHATAGSGGAAAGEPGEAGMAGDNGDPDACTITVPSGGAEGTLQSAIDAAPVPALVCLSGGGYRGDVTLRAGVDLRGIGLASVICGAVNGDAATSRITTLSDLQLEGRLSATGNVKLSLRRLEIQTHHTAICLSGSTLPVEITQIGGGELALVADGVTFGSAGFDINLKPGSERIDDSIVIQNSRCNSTSQCYDFLHFSFDTQPAAQAANGSRLVLDVFDNVLRNIVLEGVVFEINGGLSAEDTAASKLWFRHNTLASRGDLNSAISFWTTPTLPVVLANNVISYIRTPVLNGDVPTVTQVGNVFSDDESSTAWFNDFAQGDFSPSANSPLIGAGASAYGVPTDIDGKPRVGGFDSGAYQH